MAIPPRRPQLLDRQALRQQLDEVNRHRLTVISAPAGFGKTTLLADWASSFEGLIAWISLDATENDPASFWNYLIAACQRLYPPLEHLITPLLQSPGSLPIDTVLVSLVNTLACSLSPLVLVLDDYHLITSQKIHQDMIFFVEHLPAPMHLIISTRSDPPLPLARFRARGSLYELRALDLRFSPEETSLFLQQELGVVLSEGGMLEVIEQHLEGWPAGLHLLALSLKHRTDKLLWLSTWNGRHRHISTYLIEEVLDQQSSEVQEFLLCTSFLPRLTGSLCNAVSGRSDGDRMLEYLEEANLFTVALDEDRSWYRYHHLFAEVLQHRQRKLTGTAHVAKIYRRACAWYKQQGFFLESVEAAMSAEDYDEAAIMLEQQGIPVTEGYPYERFVSWIERLPSAVLTRHPQLAMWYNSALIMMGELQKLDEASQRAAQGFEEQGKLTRLGATLAHQAVRCYWLGHTSSFFAYREKALPYLSGEAPVEKDARSLMTGFVALHTGQVQLALPIFAESLRVNEGIPNFSGFISCKLRLADLLRMQGKLQEAARHYQQVIERTRDLRFPASEVLARWSQVLLEWDQLSEAEAALQQALASAQHMQHTKLLSLGALYHARLLLARGETVLAEQRLQEAFQLACRYDHQEVYREALIERARVALIQGDYVTTEHCLSACAVQIDDAPAYAQEAAYLLLSRWLIAQGKARLVLDHLPRWRQVAREDGRGEREIEMLLIQSLAYAALQEREQALDALALTLHLAEPGGYLRLFLNEGQPVQCLLIQLGERTPSQQPSVQRLLAHFPISEQKASAQKELVEKKALAAGSQKPLPLLSTREKEILRLIAAGASNEDIAEQLVIAYSTVKRHVSNILVKLSATNRTQAVALAREQGWLCEM
ncbi:helix-turn-helix transcriptional regulator [Dictyobacter aurantiacus]|uniref:Helix-turn-helix transcriptional regulator n=1 Tax=Dictyobacter aurantiacus TaxID=1936993 RepID=A0A401ZT50_9CHLR|nr:helix-turn-helix transcriptional regulator [Dictyobacter aurantiacus]